MKAALNIASVALAATIVGCSAATPDSPEGPSLHVGQTAPRPGARHPDNTRPDWWHSTVKLTNASSWAIRNVYLTPFDAEHWGRDQLGTHTLKTGASLELTGIACDTYDIRLVDEEGDACIIQDVDLCLQDARWTLDNDELVGCQAETSTDGHAKST